MRYKRVAIARTGGPEVLEMIEEEVPRPGANQVLVRVQAAGVARADLLMRKGKYPGRVPALPYSPGYDIAGIIEEVGEGVTGLRKGQPVVALTKTGGYSQFMCFCTEDLVAAPAGLDPAEAVSLGLNYITAHQMLHRFAKVRQGERVLVHAAASGVGTALIQLGALVGLEQYGTASTGKHDVVLSLGARPIDYRSEDFLVRIREWTGKGVDAVFDPVGGAHLWRSFQALQRGGRLVAYGEMSVTQAARPSMVESLQHRAIPVLLRFGPGGRKAMWYECYPTNKEHPDWYHGDLSLLMEMLAQGKLKPVVAERLPLHQAALAHIKLEAAAVSGKIVLMCG